MNKVITIIKKTTFLSLSLSVLFNYLFLPSSARADTLDNLLKKVMEERQMESKEFQKREQIFKTEKDQRNLLLNKALQELKKEEAISQRLTAEFEKNEKELAILENELNLAVGTLGELFGVVKQIAGDFRGQVLNSIVSAEVPGRENFAENISARKKLPTTKELRQLWFEIQREMTELGKVTQFETEVVTLDGKKSRQKVTRVGGFNLVSRGKYLNFQGDPAQIVELARQPQNQFTRYIKKLEKNVNTTSKQVRDQYPMFALDPTRGSLISILIRTPGFFERIRQGGMVGLVIICVLIFGIGLVIGKMDCHNEGNKKNKRSVKKPRTKRG